MLNQRPPWYVQCITWRLYACCVTEFSWRWSNSIIQQRSCCTLQFHQLPAPGVAIFSPVSIFMYSCVSWLWTSGKVILNQLHLVSLKSFLFLLLFFILSTVGIIKLNEFYKAKQLIWLCFKVVNYLLNSKAKLTIFQCAIFSWATN